LTAQTQPMPAFGQADLSNCEREQIHLAGSIQPHGALLFVPAADGPILQLSANARAYLNCEFDPLNRTLASFGGNLFEEVKKVDPVAIQTAPEVLRCRIDTCDHDFDVFVHSPTGTGLVLEFERANRWPDQMSIVERSLKAINDAPSLRSLCEEAAGLFKELIGYDRVMVYRFDDDGHGEVFSERKEPHLEAFVGNRYPASDIPQIARRLYERVRVRMLVDVDYAPAPIEPRINPLTGTELDMSLCFLRSMSPIHIQYLKNMGVSATLVASLVVGNRLWGLIACHHYSPRNIPFNARTTTELLAEAVAIRISALENLAVAQAELSVRRLEQYMVEALSQDGDWHKALVDNSQSLLQPVRATGVALLCDGQLITAGDVPGTQQLRDIAAWLDDKPREPVFATASLGFDEPRFVTFSPMATGLVAAPVSNSPREYLIWFRPEQIQMVTWGGDPQKAVVIGDDPRDLSPRRSFAKWQQVVEGKCEPWTMADLAAARLIGETVADVVLESRSARMLISRDQLDAVTRQVRITEIPTVIADADGQILHVNPAFESLIGRPHPRWTRLEDIVPLFEKPEDARRRLHDLVHSQKSWRGETSIVGDDGSTRPVLVRGDSVLATQRRVLGNVLFFTEVVHRKMAEDEARRLHYNIISRICRAGDGSSADRVNQRLVSSLMENAQIAVFEISNVADAQRRLDNVESLCTSVNRAVDVLDYLAREAKVNNHDL